MGETTRSAFLGLHRENKMYKWVYYHYPQRWTEVILDDDIKELTKEDKWSDYIKYLDENKKISESVKNIPSDKGGIYVFFVQGTTLPFLERHIAYIGRALFHENKENLKKRVTHYKYDNRILIQQLFQDYQDNLYIRYLPCDCDNDTIDYLEKLLIHAIFPPFNNKIVDKIIIKPAVKAF